MTTEIEPSFSQRSILPLIQALVRCKICKKRATSYFVTSEGRIVLLCEHCFQTCNLLYKQQINNREEDGEILEDDLDRSAI
jgi:hypothetical protein